MVVLATGRALTKSLEDSSKRIEQGLPYFDVVQFNQSLYQISLASCKAIWSADPKKVKIVKDYVRSQIRFLRSVKPNRQEEKIAREMLSGELEVISRVLQKAHQELCEAQLKKHSPSGNPGNPSFSLSGTKSSTETFLYIENFIVKMILTRNPSKACDIQDRINQMASNAYRNKKSKEFRKLCAYSNALLYFKSAVSLI